MAPHTHTYSFLPCYQTYHSKLISKKFPKKLRAPLSDLQSRTRNFYRFLEISISHYPDLQGNFFRFRKFSLPVACYPVPRPTIWIWNSRFASEFNPSPPRCVQMDFMRTFQTNAKCNNINHVWSQFYKILVVLNWLQTLFILLHLALAWMSK